MKILGRKINIAPLLRTAGIRTGPVSIIETEGMYPYKKKIEENWAYYTAVGCKRLKELFRKEGKAVKSIGIIGICSGVEGIAIGRIFSGADRLIVTDIDEEILEGTIYNLRHAGLNKNTKIIPLVGSFCEPIKKAGYKVDFVHGNIPNLPATGEEDLTKGAEKGTFLLPETYEGYKPPQKFIQWALGAQFAYLKSAQKVLASGGSVITELGGRMPYAVIKDLFSSCDLALQEIIVGFKEQTEALIDFEGYHRVEREYGTEFEFYLYEESVKILRKNKIENPSYKTTGEEVKKLLRPYKISAGKALRLYKKGVPIGHTLHLLRGIKRK